jgi:hypothetical protein
MDEVDRDALMRIAAFVHVRGLGEVRTCQISQLLAIGR